MLSAVNENLTTQGGPPVRCRQCHNSSTRLNIHRYHAQQMNETKIVLYLQQFFFSNNNIPLIKYIKVVFIDL